VSQQTTNRSFDELARGLANGSISRRKAIKFIAATTLGGFLGLSGIGTAFAKNKTCAQWCAAVFGAHTPAAGQCTSDAAHGMGLCSKCGTTTPPSSVCCTRNSSNNCISYSGASCPCGSSATCLNGSCCPTDQVCGSTCGCPPGQVCQAGTCCTSNGGTCTSGGDCCSGNCKSGTCVASCIPPSATPCQSGGDCDGCGGCGPEVSGGAYCGGQNTSTPCTTSCDCPAGQFCHAIFPTNRCSTVCTPSTP
jgi:hypothetical protein